MKKKTLVIGASEKPERYSNKAIRALRAHEHPVVALAPRNGKVDDVEFITQKIDIPELDTVTMYIGEKIQKEYYDYVIQLKPSRVIFNPGTENHEFVKILEKNGIKAEFACTLLLLAIDEY
jgi:predicted CoA-binding protein